MDSGEDRIPIRPTNGHADISEWQLVIHSENLDPYHTPAVP